MLLDTEINASLNISSSAVVLTYTNDTGRDLAVLSKVELGSVSNPIAGNGIYRLDANINGFPMHPSSVVPVGDVDTSAMQSRILTLRDGETIVITVVGQAGDVAVPTEAILMDVTPPLITELIGEGPIIVDHNYGGVDALKVVDHSGAAVQGASIVAYLTTEYDAGNRAGTFIRGRSYTDAYGHWRNVMALHAGEYTLITVKPGHTLPTITELTVS